MGGVASRRESDKLILAATTTVNGILQTDPAYSVSEDDDVIFDGKRVTIEKNIWVIVLNKPKGFITTQNDPQGRKTVMELVPKNHGYLPLAGLIEIPLVFYY